MQIGITGVSGFIGKYLKDFLIDDYSIVEIDLRQNVLEVYDFTDIDAIIHLAGIAHNNKVTSEDEYYLINRDLAYKTAEKAKKEGVKHFIFISTAKVYGDASLNNEVFDEVSICKPSDAYANSKFEAEKLISSISDDSFKVAIVRPPLVYGPGVKANMLNLISLIRKLPLIPLKGINNERSMVFIGNLVSLLKCIVERGASGIFLPTDSKAISTSELVRIIAVNLKRERRLIVFPTFLIKLIKLLFPYYYVRIFSSFVMNSEKTLIELKHTIPFTNENGISITVQWILNQKNHQSNEI